MTVYTRVGSSIWHWEPLCNLDSDSRLLWMSLYTSAEARRLVPGIFCGSITTMAESARMSGDSVVASLDRLLEHDLVEYDRKLRVLRLTQLPDCGESPANGKIVLSWWIRFKSIPSCAVRDAHVTTLRWIMEEWSRENGKVISGDHERAWKSTFGQVVIPAPRRRGVRRLAESDTSTASQPSLFDAPSKPSVDVGDTVGAETYPQTDAGSVDNSAVLRQSKEIRDLDTVSDTVSKRSRSGSVPGSGSSSLLFGGAEGDPGEERERPRLALVPPPADDLSTPDGLCAQLAAATGGKYRGDVRQDVQAALQLRVRELAAACAGPPELAVVGRWIAMDAGVVAQIPGDPSSKLSVWASQPGAILAALTAAQRHEQQEAERRDALQDSLRALGMLPGDR